MAQERLRCDLLKQHRSTAMKCRRKLCQTLPLTFLIPVTTAIAAPYTLRIQDTIGRSWQEELINWQLTLKPGEFKGGPVLVKRDGNAIAAQADVPEKHPDGSAKMVDLRFVIDRLDSNGVTQLTA